MIFPKKNLEQHNRLIFYLLLKIYKTNSKKVSQESLINLKLLEAS